MARLAADALRLRSSRRRPGPGRTPAPPASGKTSSGVRAALLPWPSPPLAARRRSRREWQLPRSRCPDAPSVQPLSLSDAGRAHGRPRRVLPRTLRRCRKVAPRDVATLPCGAGVGGGQLWRPGGRRGGSSSRLSAAPSRAAAVSSPPSAAPSAGMRRRAG